GCTMRKLPGGDIGDALGLTRVAVSISAPDSAPLDRFTSDANELPSVLGLIAENSCRENVHDPMIRAPGQGLAVYRVRGQEALKGRLALDLQWDQQASGRLATIATLHQAQVGA